MHFNLEITLLLTSGTINLHAYLFTDTTEHGRWPWLRWPWPCILIYWHHRARQLTLAEGTLTLHTYLLTPQSTAADLGWGDLDFRSGDLLLRLLVVNDGEREEVSVSSDREEKLVVEAAGELCDRAVVVVVHWQRPVRTHQAGVVVVDWLDAHAAVVHAEYQVTVAASQQCQSLIVQRGRRRCYFNVHWKDELVSLIYHTEPTTKKVETEKQKN